MINQGLDKAKKIFREGFVDGNNRKELSDREDRN